MGKKNLHANKSKIFQQHNFMFPYSDSISQMISTEITCISCCFISKFEIIDCTDTSMFHSIYCKQRLNRAQEMTNGLIENSIQLCCPVFHKLRATSL